MAVDNSVSDNDDNVDHSTLDFSEQLYARHVDVSSYDDLTAQRGTTIPALLNQFYKFTQNPSTVTVETFKRMIDTDDTIGSGVDFLTICLAARMGTYIHKSDEITQWVNQRLDEVENGFYNSVKELLSATWAGFAVQEKVWANTEDGFVPKKLVTMPPSTLLFETDRTGELTDDGILQYQRNYSPMLFNTGMGFLGGAGFGFAGSRKPDVFARYGDMPFPIRTANTYNYLSIRIPKYKCIHYAFDAQGKFGNPYGRSLLRRIYKYYISKDSYLQMMAVALDRKGTPLTVVYADPNTTLLDPSKTGSASGGPNQRGMRGQGIRADVAARNAFENIHNDSVVILPGKKGQIFDVDMSMPHGADTGVFTQALDFTNKSIIRGLLIPSLIFSNGDGTGSYSLGQEHAKTWEKTMDGCLEGVQHALLYQLIREMIAYNFPESAWKKDGLGSFSKRELTTDEREKEMNVFEKGINAGVIDANELADLNKMRESLGFEPRDTLIEKPLAANPFGGFGEHGFGGEGNGDFEGNVGKVPPGEPGGEEGGRGSAGREQGAPHDQGRGGGGQETEGGRGRSEDRGSPGGPPKPQGG